MLSPCEASKDEIVQITKTILKFLRDNNVGSSAEREINEWFASYIFRLYREINGEDFTKDTFDSDMRTYLEMYQRYFADV